MSVLDSDVVTENSTPAAKPTEAPAPSRGSRGELGVASAGLTIWQQWKSANSHLSLKAYARQQIKEGNAVAKDWFANKKGAKDQARSDKSLQRMGAEKSATKLAKRKAGKK